MPTRRPLVRSATTGRPSDMAAGDLVDPAAGGVPTGSVTAYAGSSVPAGWLPCDGAAVSRTVYADLWAAIGATWGAGNGTSTFNVPDLRGRALIGAGTGASLTARTLGQTVGVEAVTLDVSQMPSHTHPPQTPSTVYWGYRASGGVNDVSTPSGTTAAAQSATGPAGGGAAHTNMQPSAVIHHIIKT